MSNIRFLLCTPRGLQHGCLPPPSSFCRSFLPVLRPVTDLPHIFEHFAIYFATGFAFGSGYERRLVQLPIALVAFAGAIQLAQLLVRGRHARLSDFIVNSLGLCVGVISAATFSLTSSATLQLGCAAKKLSSFLRLIRLGNSG
jgi:VanZ family protein